ncbi:MAG TPA: hypothetical protein VNR65_10855 [Geobacterales bacterium]|nr:hypothetical protein [Geobacterales bacterium]
MRDLLPATFKMLSFCCLAMAVNGCAGPSMSGRPENSYTPVITEESMLTAARANSDGPIEAAASNGCPLVQVEGGQRSVTIYERNRVGDGASVVHRAEITKTARECQATMGVVQVKYGIAGRVLLGPKGKPGTVTLPAVMQVFDRAKNQVKSDPVSVTVTITRENPLSYFSIVRDVTIPVKDGTTPQDYTISLAFEKKGAA